MQVLTARIAGRRHHAGMLDASAQLRLERDRANRVDHYAVKVLANGVQVGHLEAGLARLVASMIDRGRPVFVGANGDSTSSVNLFVPARRDYAWPHPEATLFPARSSDAKRIYWVDPRRGLCTCPAGRYLDCRHQKAMASARGLRPLQARQVLASLRAQAHPVASGVRTWLQI